jgi:hypothetical protein
MRIAKEVCAFEKPVAGQDDLVGWLRAKEGGIVTDTQGEAVASRIPGSVHHARDDAVQDGVFAAVIVFHQLCQHSNALL